MYTKHSTLFHSDIPEADRVHNILAGLYMEDLTYKHFK